MRWLRPRPRPPSRAQLLEAVFERQLRAGEWQRLPPEHRDALAVQWTPILAGLSNEALAQLAQGRHADYVTHSDEALTLHLERRPPPPSDTDRLVEHINRVEKRIVFGWDPEGTLITAPMEALERHCAVPGLTGTGKSTFLANTFIQLCRQPGPRVLIDSHGTLIDAILPHIPPDRKDDVVVIDPAHVDATWGMNLLQFGKLLADGPILDRPEAVERVLEDLVETILSALGVFQEDTSGIAPGPSIRSMLYMACRAAVERDDTNINDACDILTVKELRDDLEIAAAHVAQYFAHIFPELRVEYVERGRNKLEPFRHSILTNLFCRRDEATPLQTLIEQNKIIIVDLSRTRMPASISSLAGYLFLTVLQFIIDRRVITPQTQHLVVMVDEFQNYATKTTVRWLSEGRKKKASLIVAFQQTDQIAHLEVRAALQNAGTWVVFRTSVEDAKVVAHLMGLSHPGTGAPMVSAFTQLPNREFKLCTDEPFPGGPYEGAQQRPCTTVRPLPPLPTRDDAQRIIDTFRTRSRDLYAKANDPGDRETVLDRPGPDAKGLLEALHALSLRRPNSSAQLPSTVEADPDAVGVAQVWHAGKIPVALLEGYRAAYDSAYSRPQFDRDLRALFQHRWARPGSPSNGLATVELTTKGKAQMAHLVNPKRSPLEGGRRHQATLARLYDALHRLGPLHVTIPKQGSNDRDAYVPDLILDVDESTPPLHWARKLTAKLGVHFHVEEGGQSNLAKLGHNVERANDSGHDPIVVFSSDAADKAALRNARRLHGGVTRRKQSESKDAKDAPSAGSAGGFGNAARWWVATKDGDLHQLVNDHWTNVRDILWPPQPKVGPEAAQPDLGQPKEPPSPMPAPSAEPTSKPTMDPPQASPSQEGPGLPSEAVESAFQTILNGLVAHSSTGTVPIKVAHQRLRESEATKHLDAEVIEEWALRLCALEVVETSQGPAFANADP